MIFAIAVEDSSADTKQADAKQREMTGGLRKANTDFTLHQIDLVRVVSRFVQAQRHLNIGWRQPACSLLGPLHKLVAGSLEDFIKA